MSFRDSRFRPGSPDPATTPESSRTQSNELLLAVRTSSIRPGFIFALVLIGAGLLFFLQNVGLLRIRDVWRYWPTVFLLLGLLKLYQSRSLVASVWAGFLMAVGAILLLANLGIITARGSLIWPLGLIAVGVLMLAQKTGQSFGPLSRRITAKDLEDSDDTLNEWAVFGGSKRMITSRNFKGGGLLAVFGGVEIDLRGAEISSSFGGPVVIDANATFGGIEIRVPTDWRVAVRGVGIFGGYEDKTMRSREVDETSPLLVITGFATFGGVVIQ